MFTSFTHLEAWYLKINANNGKTLSENQQLNFFPINLKCTRFVKHVSDFVINKNLEKKKTKNWAIHYKYN